ncbi:hypothetical protein SEA_MRMIYAGI_117 [Mycobacterium phage MrMiyagi]|uniref:Uncharacterized protein n=1 Tax=Mycobacterium phage MrMiyagi TaxID=2762395 RepID=A0A7G8LQ07_9CAUD|nr:hypothetical protein SEA_MRMIYAGI_117 [Mycobacterium phage MrMiyagi]
MCGKEPMGGQIVSEILARASDHLREEWERYQQQKEARFLNDLATGKVWVF